MWGYLTPCNQEVKNITEKADVRAIPNISILLFKDDTIWI